MKKIIAFDVDGTLTKSKEPLEDSMASLLIKLSKLVLIAPISGESYHQFQKQFLATWNNFADSEANSKIILLPVDGSQSFEFDAGKNEWIKIDQQEFEQEIKKLVFDGFNQILNQKELYDLPDSQEIFGDQVEDRGPEITFSALGQNAPLEKKSLWDPDQMKRKKIKSALEKFLPKDSVEIMIAGTTSIDVLSKGNNKASGLLRLLKRKNMDISDMIFVGDSVFPGGNDQPPKDAGIETIKVSGPEETANFIENFMV